MPHTRTVRESSITVLAPIDGRPVGTVQVQSPEQVGVTVGRLRAMQIPWRAMGVVGRLHWVNRFREWLLENEDSLTLLLATETGKSVGAARQEFALAVQAIDYHRTHGAEYLGVQRPRAHSLPSLAVHLSVSYHRSAVVGVITPWTYPLALTVFDIIPALLSGCAVLVKPSSVTPLTVHEIAAGWARLGAPAVLATAIGPDAGPAVLDSVDNVHFTGSADTGKVVALRAAGRLIPCRLELGGKSTAIVFADADLDRAAAAIALGGLAECGQAYHSIERVFVESTVYEVFLDKLATEVAAFGAEDPEDTDPYVMTSETHVRFVADQVRDALDKGANLRIGGVSAGHTFAPAVLADVDPAMSVLTQQTLGPVLPVMRVDTVDEAIERAMVPWCGPSVSVWTTDDATGGYVCARLPAPNTAVNDVSVHLAPPTFA
ncbi:aldehyde dehydrogenase family protein [Nocardia uniformis]|uniref:Aldehyde dehydrogenase family protein n=1 Tax=Nocardia uniformis TaxID=53432 RepID=A0A849CDD1_9NOCA|nr:aldehyde dehydrogenase family protein [Nocardia uniformis]NNH75976.1 aldehyde dehydrogenase family protein [Nocardia uniformis]